MRACLAIFLKNACFILEDKFSRFEGESSHDEKKMMNEKFFIVQEGLQTWSETHFSQRNVEKGFAKCAAKEKGPSDEITNHKTY